MASIADPCGERRIALTKLLMILTSHRLDCLKISLGLLEKSNAFAAFDRVIFLENGLEPSHRAFIDRFIDAHPGIAWDHVTGPRGRSERISGLENDCVRKYPGCVYVKMDEDVFVPSGWAERMLAAYERHRSDPDLALITPLIPNNPYGLYKLLTKYYPAHLAEHRSRFGCDPAPEIHGLTWQSPAVAEWATRLFIDLEDCNAHHRELITAAQKETDDVFSDPFSVGCVCFDYRHWEKMGGIPPKDEPEWCAWIQQHAQHNILDGSQIALHYSFFVQQDWLDRTTLLEDIRRTNLPETCPPGFGLWRHLPRLARTARQIPTVIRRRLGRES